jgi:hypothetical protein
MNPTTQDNPTELVIQYPIVTIDQVMRFFAQAYKPQDGVVKDHEYYIDTAKGKVVFKLYIEVPTQPTKDKADEQ